MKRARGPTIEGLQVHVIVAQLVPDAEGNMKNDWLKNPQTWPGLAMIAQVLGVWLGLVLIRTYG
jgi:hypothetical protein